MLVPKKTDGELLRSDEENKKMTDNHNAAIGVVEISKLSTFAVTNYGAGDCVMSYLRQAQLLTPVTSRALSILQEKISGGVEARIGFVEQLGAAAIAMPTKDSTNILDAWSMMLINAHASDIYRGSHPRIKHGPMSILHGVVTQLGDALL